MPEPALALLRGINVGGRNIISMADLRAAFESDGFRDVRTYIQSGNVVFSTDLPQDALEPSLEDLLARHVGRPITVVVRARSQVRAVVEDAPAGFGAEPEAYKYDVMFLKAPLTADEVLDVLPLREGVDRAWHGDGVVYFSRRTDALTRSRMSRITGMAVYRSMTIRNWRTTTTLLGLLDEL